MSIVSSLNDLPVTQDVASRIIDFIGSSGQPPEYGLELFSSGWDGFLETIDYEYLDTYIKAGGTAFKVLTAGYGSGKTHFLYCVRNLAFKHNYAVSYVTLNYQDIPFSDLAAVYKAIVSNIVYPLSAEELLSDHERGIENFINVWYFGKYEEFKIGGLSDDAVRTNLRTYISKIGNLPSSNFSRILRIAFLSKVDRREDSFNLAIQWLKAEGSVTVIQTDHQKRRIKKTDKNNALLMIYSLIQWIKQIGYSGVVILFDEVERNPVAQNIRNRKVLSAVLSNLREFIDECANNRMHNSIIFYAVPDLNFLSQRETAYPALNQRLNRIFWEYYNPRGIVLDLEIHPDLLPEVLKEIGLKLAAIYEIAYGITLPADNLAQSINNLLKTVLETRVSDGIMRLYVQAATRIFNLQKSRPNTIVSPQEAETIITKLRQMS